MTTLGKFYITTPIYYTNDKPHLGHVFEVVGIDVQARFRRLLGHSVYFLTGTDEHGQKIQNQAAARGIPPQEFVDRLAEQFQALWARLLVSNDDFIRTTQPRHHAACQELWRRVAARGHIYTGRYEGWYNTRDENYMSDEELKKEGLSKDDPHIKWMQEECFFFRLSSFQKEIEALFARPDYCLPEFRAKEMSGSFIRPGLKDVSISRSTIDWGIPVPDAPGHVMYVWFDALSNYISAIGYGRGDAWREWWPADGHVVHVVGKDILKFHTILWPAMLIAGGVPPPSQVFGHGFITLGDEKMSKSRGNVIDPVDLIDDYGVEPLRYYLLREVSYGGDGAFVEENLRARYTADLANGLGNLFSRSVAMIEKNSGGEVRIARSDGAEEGAIVARFAEIFDAYEKLMTSFDFAQALARVWEGVATLDRYINEKKPWTLAKDAGRRQELATVLYVLAEGLRMLGSLVQPFMPETAAEIWRRLGLTRTHLEIDWAAHRRWGLLTNGLRVTKGAPLFPRLENKPAP
jgi:methionyl-tRNA synthetase